LVPEVRLGQATGVQVLMKKGVVVVATTPPLLPARQEHPVGTSAPQEPLGQATGVHEPVKKKGESEVAMTLPL